MPHNNNSVSTDAPVIAVLAQEYYGDFGNYTPGTVPYIAASYVKYIEGSGGRVLPVFLDKPQSYYEQLITLVNGLLLPGGAQYLDGSSAYEQKGRFLISLAKKLNSQGTYFPVWGTCLGFELMALEESQDDQILSPCEGHNTALPLEFTGNPENSRLFRSLSPENLQILSKENVTFNYHRKCVTRESFEKTPLKNSYSVLAVNHDKDGKEFISAFESKNWPMYGVQFHPEKNIYEFVNQKKGYTKIPHSREAIRISQYFADFFVDECRNNSNSWNVSNSKEYPLIYSFKPEHTIDYEPFEQMYFFP